MPSRWSVFSKGLQSWTTRKVSILSDGPETPSRQDEVRPPIMSSIPQPRVEPVVGIATGYRGGAGIYDELLGAAGAVQSHWLPLLASLDALGPKARAERIDRLNMRVRETGIAHDLFVDPNEPAPHWRLQFMPLILPAAEWRELEKAVIQRARLFEMIVADVYGRQQLMAAGHIPPSLVFSDPSFLRPCYSLPPHGGYLQFFSMDIARGHDGRWRVIDTHAETPAGIGYAVANRTVHTHIAGEMFTATNALRLAPFFEELQSSLTQRINRADPTIALLTPGPHHNDFFGHAYLARYLGFLLVEGGDLRVDGERAFLKTLEGLKPIDLIVRCVTGSAADPLELDPSGFLGPVGLVQAVRRQPDLVANALGSAVAENRGLGPYLPALASILLGEELLIGDGVKFWLGDPKARAEVFANLDLYVIRPAHERTARPGRAMPGRDPARMSKAARETLKVEMDLNGAAFVAEAKIGFGTTPSFGPDGLVAKPYALRLFAAATPNGPVVMPGGLAMTVDPQAAVSLSAPDGESRDVWIVSDGAVPPFHSLWRPSSETARIQRSPRELPSRAADNLFWLGRYVERADWTLRVLRQALGRLEEGSGARLDLGPVRKSLESILAKDAIYRMASAPATDAPLIQHLARLLLTSRDLSFGVPETLGHIHRIASLVRDRLSQEAWRTLNSFQARPGWQAANSPTTIGETIDLLDSGLGALSAFNGLMHENMTRNFGWTFLDMGRRLARATGVADLILAVFALAEREETDAASLAFVLDVADSSMTYRARYRQTPALPLVLDLLLVDETNPRSLAFQLAALSNHIEELPLGGPYSGRIEESRQLLSLLTQVRVAEVNRLSEPAADGTRTGLVALLTEQTRKLPELSDAIARRYFALAEKESRWVRSGGMPSR